MASGGWRSSWCIIHHVANSFHAEFGLNGLVVQGLRSGWVGVDLFFVLSGFLITGILFDAKDSPGYFRNFYARRALRVFPLYYAALVVAFIAARAWPGPESITGTGQYSFGLWLYLTNIFLAKGGWATYRRPDTSGPSPSKSTSTWCGRCWCSRCRGGPCCASQRPLS